MKRGDQAILTEIAESGLGAWDAKPFLEKVAAIAPSVIYIFNQKTQSNEYSNRGLAETLGYSSAEVQEMGATLMPRLLHPDDGMALMQYFDRVRALNDGEMLQFEYRMRHADGHWVWLLSNDTVFERDSDGSVLRHIGTATDISMQKRAEAVALAEKQAADTANEELRSFAYSISHDMKSPSNTMSLILSELRETQGAKLDADGQELIELGLQTAARMQTLIEDVLHYTRVVGDEVAKEDVDLAKLLSEILVDMQGDIKDFSAVVEVGELPIVFGSRMQLRILFSNLIANAFKYHRPGVPPHVKVSDTTDATSSDLSISVEDNGIGIPDGAHEKIFTIFKRLHLQDEVPGSGLGLAICKRVMMSHGGRLNLRSKQGEGSVFTAHFPRKGTTL